jgi:hypothetical protein
MELDPHGWCIRARDNGNILPLDQAREHYLKAALVDLGMLLWHAREFEAINKISQPAQRF